MTVASSHTPAEPGLVSSTASLLSLSKPLTAFLSVLVLEDRLLMVRIQRCPLLTEEGDSIPSFLSTFCTTYQVAPDCVLVFSERLSLKKLSCL